MKRLRFDFDGALKSFFETERPGLLRELTGGKSVKQFLNVELPTVRTRKVDLLLLLEDDTILHVELQSGNHREMALRMAEYYLLLVRKFGKPVKQVVLYLGAAPMTMASGLDHPSMKFSYELKDIRSWNADDLLESDHSADHVLALLAGGRTDSLQLIRDVVGKIAKMQGPAKERALAFAGVLAGLRGFETIIIEEAVSMGQVIDWRTNGFLKALHKDWIAEGMELGRDEGVAQGRKVLISVAKSNLSRTFGPLPQWALNQLESASLEQLGEWAANSVGAQSLETLLGVRQQ